MHRRPAVVVLGTDPGVEGRVRSIIEGTGSPASCEGAPVTVISAPADGPFNGDRDPSGIDVRAVVTTFDDLKGHALPEYLDRDSTADGQQTSHGEASVFVVVSERDPERYRRAFLAGADDVFGPHEGPADTDPLSGPLVKAATDPNPGLSSVNIDTLRSVVLDAATTLMGAEVDEVRTKVEWTLANVGEHSSLDRIIVYRDAGIQFTPAFVWAEDPFEPEGRSFDSFPAPDRLAGFENVASEGTTTGIHEGGETAMNATVHVPLVSEWELIGVVVFEVDSPRPWVDEEVDLYRTLADLIAHMLVRNDRRRELGRQTERLEQFSAVVSHDLRNPLNVMSGYLDLASDDIDAPHYRAMENAIRRMETLIDDLLMLARRGDAIGETEPVPAAAIAEDAWESVRTPRATLTVVDGIGHVDADPGRLRQAFENLFRNAIDHGGPDVTVEVGPRTVDERVTGMYVADDGPGIPPEVRDSIFESGFSTAGSSGIGLAIVARVAEGHGWTVDVDTRDGAVFEFTFDAEQPTATIQPDHNLREA